MFRWEYAAIFWSEDFIKYMYLKTYKAQLVNRMWSFYLFSKILLPHYLFKSASSRWEINVVSYTVKCMKSLSHLFLCKIVKGMFLFVYIIFKCTNKVWTIRDGQRKRTNKKYLQIIYGNWQSTLITKIMVCCNQQNQ